jgi:16S rRNA (guanine(1405)-N(7))-methyltransferase
MSDRPDPDAIQQTVVRVRSAAKYRNVCVETIRRLAVEEWAKRAVEGRPRERAQREVAKAVRSRLHQVYGAYESRVDYGRAYQAIAAAYAGGSPDGIRATCREVLSRHASTRERLPILRQFYAAIWAQTGVPRALLDLACGLNPLSVPWMGLGEGTTYHAYDIDAARVAFLERYLALAGLQGGAHLQDILCDPPAERADVALLMKSSACLERQRKDSTLSLLDTLDVRWAVVTYPVRSLGRRDKGMVDHYDRAVAEMLSDRPWPVTRLDLAEELAFVIRVDLAETRS